jgi:hypothetical protein
MQVATVCVFTFLHKKCSSDYIDIFYQNVSGLDTKCTNFYVNVCAKEP